MSSADFEKDVIDSLARLETKMNLLVGEDGNGGFKADIEQRMRKQESRRSRGWRMTGLTSLASAIGGGIAAWIFKHFFGQ